MLMVVIPIPNGKVDEYREIASKAGRIWKDHGALAYREGVGEDIDIQEQVPFPTLAGAKEGETVIFAFIAYKSREHRYQINALDRGYLR